MNPPIFWLLVALGAGALAAWRRAVVRRRGAAAKNVRARAAQAAPRAARPSAPKADAASPAAEPVTAAAPAPPSAAEIEAARAGARAKAERVIAAEAARRKAAIQKAQNLARVEAERRAARAAAEAAAVATTLPMHPLPAPAKAPPAVAAPAVFKTVDQTLVMLVDDSKMVRVKSSRLLASQGFQVVTAVDGLDALRQLETCCPDLVITDVDMPGMDGFGLTNALRGNPRTNRIPIVMITSAEDRHREEALRIGVGLVLGKPYPEDALIAHLRSFRFVAKARAVESLACA